VRIQVGAHEVHAAIYFHDEPCRGTGKVCDEAPDDELAAEGDAELAAAQLSPKQLLRERGLVAHAVSVSLKLELTVTDETLLLT
jgi:hypothetical protein